MELKFQIQKTALLDRFKYELKNIPIVEGIVLKNEISNDKVTNDLFIIVNTEPSYIKKITGVNYYKETNRLRHKLEELRWQKKGTEDADEIEKASQLLTQVTEYETEIYDKLITDLNRKVNEIIKEINALELKINISTSSLYTYETVEDENYRVGYQVFFNRLNNIKINTPEEIINKKIKVI